MPFVTGPLPQRLKIIHGFGAVAFGVKDSGFSFFLLIFYNQALGMDAGAVSLALALALLIDAFVDPLLGNLSDRTWSRWGRRLPWLYAAPIPLAFAWVLMWHPPGGGTPSFWELLAIAVSVRVLLSACEVPSVSLLPEITADYDDRTTLFRYRYLFGWCGGLVMMVLAYFVFMPGAEGLLQPDGYFWFGLVGAILMVISVLGSALGQHSLVAGYPETRPPPFSWRGAFGEIFDAFSERAFLIFAAGALAAYISQGLTFSLTNYVNIFVWQFDTTELRIFPVILFLSVIAMFFIVGPMHRRWGKPKSAVIGAIGSFAVVGTPFMLFLAGFWPEVGSPASAAAFYSFLFVSNTLGVVVMISASSMIAEIVEAYQERTGRRAEGSFYSGNWFVQKCATGGGILLGGQVIALSNLPAGASPETVSPDVVSTIIWLYCGSISVLGCIAAFWLGRFPIDRAQHEARLAALDAAARADVDAAVTPP
ncbi:MFS transporter [Qipengyuania flava]|uniref:MFS transporter n=1 Tax=Qipengyuania flava TaxID=192812 RepID=UPI001C63A383|nr:MFS transporter [Qipengyuania flava]QYJ06996.1 MFS transporter [Qipengyuania flava]